MSKCRRGFALVAILIVAALVIGIGATLGYQKLKTKPSPSPSPTDRSVNLTEPTPSSADETENWKIYKDELFGFEVKYPQNMKAAKIEDRNDLAEEADLLGGLQLNLKYADEKFRPQASEINVWVFDSDNLRLKEWLIKHSTSSPFGSAERKEFYGYKGLGSKIVDSMQGIKFTHDVMGFASTKTAILKGNKVYLIGYVYVSDDLEREYNQILSTFRFLE